MQVFGIRTKPAKYYCCDCNKKLSARAKTPEWRKIPADQKRCRRCAARYRGLLRQGINKRSLTPVLNADPTLSELYVSKIERKT